MLIHRSLWGRNWVQIVARGGLREGWKYFLSFTISKVLTNKSCARTTVWLTKKVIGENPKWWCHYCLKEKEWHCTEHGESRTKFTVMDHNLVSMDYQHVMISGKFVTIHQWPNPLSWESKLPFATKSERIYVNTRWRI